MGEKEYLCILRQTFSILSYYHKKVRFDRLSNTELINYRNETVHWSVASDSVCLPHVR